MTNVDTITVGEFQANCHLVWCTPCKSAIVIDPGSDPLQIQASLEDKGLSVASYMLTHGHVDHISALSELHKSFPAPIGLHADDLKWAFGDMNRMQPFYNAPSLPARIERTLEDGQEWSDAGLTFTVLATPGHTPGSVCFAFRKQHLLFSGDLLFAGSVGRTDLAGGDSRLMQKSLTKIAGLPDETVVYPGHGHQTSIGSEKRTNFFMQSAVSPTNRSLA